MIMTVFIYPFLGLLWLELHKQHCKTVIKENVLMSLVEKRTFVVYKNDDEKRESMKKICKN